MAPNQKQLKWMNYYAQLDLDKATRMPGNVVPSASADSNGNPIGYYYFGINPNDGTPLRSDEYIFVPNKNVITGVEVVDGQIVYTRATGEASGAIDVDDNTRDLARIIMLNSPDQSATKDYWESQLDVSTEEKPLDRGFDKNQKPAIDPDDPGTIVDSNINIDDDKDIIVINPNKNPDNKNNDQFPPEPIIEGPLKDLTWRVIEYQKKL